jgi:tetratricopeptide (TPR) repeat protein
VGFWNNLFGSSFEKQEEKGDERRLDLLYRDAAYYYAKAFEALSDPQSEHGLRINNKLREVRRKALAELLEEATELAAQDDYGLARDKIELAATFADDATSSQEVGRRLEELADLAQERNPRIESADGPPDEVSGGAEVFELAIEGLDPDDQEVARRLGEPFQVAYEACQNEQWEESLATFDTLFETEPHAPLLREMAGLCCERLERFAEARDHYQRSVAASPDRPAAVQGLSAVLRKLDDPDGATGVLADAVAAHPAEPGLSEAWGTVHVEYAQDRSGRGEHDAAIETIAGLMDAGVLDRGYLRFNLAGILELAGRDDDARAALEAAMQSSPRNSLYRERLADFLVKRGLELDEALKLLVTANELETTGGAGMFGGTSTGVKISPNRGRYLYKMARIYYLKGEDLEAEKTITTAMAITKEPEVLAALQELRRDVAESQA